MLCRILLFSQQNHQLRTPRVKVEEERRIRTPHRRQYKLHSRIPLPILIQTNRHRRLRNDNSPHMMQHSNRAHLDPKNQLKFIHGDQNLRADDQYVARGDDVVGSVGRVEVCGEKGDADRGRTL